METRVRSALNVYLYLVLGVFLVAVPWSSIWDQAVLLVAPGPVGALFESGWLRGTVSGIGLLDLVIAVREARALRRLYLSCAENGNR